MLRIAPLLLLFLAACDPTPREVTAPAPIRPAPSRGAEIAALEAANAPPAIIPTQISDVDWALTVLNDRLVGRVMEVDLSGGLIDGTGPCEDIRGNYFGTGEIFVVETIVVPRLPNCARAQLQEEIAIAMIDARSAHVENGVLVVRDAGGIIRLEFLPL